MTFDDVRKFALTWPEVEDGTSYGTPALKVRKKMLARLKEDGDSLVMPDVPIDERAMLVDAVGQKSALVEAECMRRLMPRDDFLGWFDRFLPQIEAGQPQTLFSPARVSDRSDGKIAHLDGLNLSRAWCWRALGKAIPEDDPRRSMMVAAAEAHLAAALPHVAGDYMGEHWLASFALLAMTE